MIWAADTYLVALETTTCPNFIELSNFLSKKFFLNVE